MGSRIKLDQLYFSQQIYLQITINQLPTLRSFRYHLQTSGKLIFWYTIEFRYFNICILIRWEIKETARIVGNGQLLYIVPRRPPGRNRGSHLQTRVSMGENWKRWSRNWPVDEFVICKRYPESGNAVSTDSASKLTKLGRSSGFSADKGSRCRLMTTHLTEKFNRKDATLYCICRVDLDDFLFWSIQT